MFKYALFLVVAFCAVQSFQARSVDRREDIDAIDRLMHLVYKVKDVLYKFNDSFPQILVDMQDKMLGVINDNDLKGILQHLVDVMQSIYEMGEKGQQCADAQSKPVGELIQNSQSAGAVCLANIEHDADNIKAEMQTLANQSNDLITRVASVIRQCITNGGDVFGCLDSLVDPMMEVLSIVEKQIADASANLKHMADEGVHKMDQCLATIKADIIEKGRTILTEATNCVNDIN